MSTKKNSTKKNIINRNSVKKNSHEKNKTHQTNTYQTNRLARKGIKKLGKKSKPLLLDYEVNFYRKKKIQDKIFLSTDLATWVLLSEKEYADFRTNRMSDELFKKLESACIILTDRNKELVKEQFQRHYWHLLTGASLHIIVPSLRCNHTCKYCYANRVPMTAKGFDMSIETATKVVDFIFQSPAQTMTIEFTGGEPFLNFPVVQHIVQYSKELNKKYNKKIYYALISNGTLWDEEKIRYCLQEGIGLCISLDGPKEVHDSNRMYLDGRPTYDDVIKKIQLYKSIAGRAPNALPVISRASLGKWKEIVDEYIKHGVDVLRFKFVTYFGFAERMWKEVGYAPAEFIDAWKKTFDYILELNKKGVSLREGMGGILVQKILSMRDVGFCELQVPCGAARGQILYHYNGDIYPCDESRIFPEFKIGNVHTHTYKEVLTSPLVNAFLNMSSNLSLKCDSCAYYAFCGLCPLQAYSQRRNIRPYIPGDMKGEIHREMINHILKKIVTSKEDLKILTELYKRKEEHPVEAFYQIS